MSKKSRSCPLEKIPTGIAGFDHLTGGGLPSERTSVVLGPAGSGKTVFAMQTLVSAALRGEPGIFVSFNEHPRHIVEHGSTFGWDLAAWEGQKLVFLNAGLRPAVVKPGVFDLTGMLAGLRSVASEMDARHFVFDSVDVLMRLLDEPRAELHELFRLREWLLEHEFTALLTANAQTADPADARREAYFQAFADCAFRLNVSAEGENPSRSVRVVKYRGSTCLSNEFPVCIGSSGLEVLTRPRRVARTVDNIAALRPEIEAARKKLTDRVRVLDQFLDMKKAEADFLSDSKSRAQRQRPALATRSAKKPSVKVAPKAPAQ